jgi:hypothetical protein
MASAQTIPVNDDYCLTYCSHGKDKCNYLHRDYYYNDQIDSECKSSPCPTNPSWQLHELSCPHAKWLAKHPEHRCDEKEYCRIVDIDKLDAEQLKLFINLYDEIEPMTVWQQKPFPKEAKDDDFEGWIWDCLEEQWKKVPGPDDDNFEGWCPDPDYPSKLNKCTTSRRRHSENDYYWDFGRNKWILSL